LKNKKEVAGKKGIKGKGGSSCIFSPRLFFRWEGSIKKAIVKIAFSIKVY